jgi:osmoprotectant transport system ATP-binding protein
MHEGKLQQIGTPEELIINPANRLIADLVDADYKFKHIETLKVKDLMTPLPSTLTISNNFTVLQALNHMKKHNHELAIIMDKSIFKGVVNLKNIINQDMNDSIKRLTEETLTFDHNDSMEMALQKMKHKKQSMAIVLDKTKPIGILLPDEVLIKLI